MSTHTTPTGERKALRDVERRLPDAQQPVASYVLVKRAGNLVFTSGNTPYREGRMLVEGKLGDQVDIERGREAAEIALFNCLASLKAELGSLDRVVSVVNMTVYIASAEGFHEQSAVANRASELLEECFGEAGRHTRAALGVYELPLGAPVEISMVVEI